MTNKQDTTISISVTENDFIKACSLSPIYSSHKDLTFSSRTTNRPSFILAGWTDHFSSNRIQVFGRTEMTYLDTLPSTIASERLDWLCSKKVPCIIISRNIKPPEALLIAAKKYDVPLFSSKNLTPKLIHGLFTYLNDLLAPTDTLHGVLLDVFGIGVLITGKSGIGKSETALELVHRGNRLVSDDIVDIKNISGSLYGTSPTITSEMMEVRGLGIMNIRAVYGIGAVLKRKRIHVVIELEEWDNFKDYVRTGGTHYTAKILGEEIPRYVIPVIPGRNIAILIEAAVSDFRLREESYNPLDEIDRRMHYLDT